MTAFIDDIQICQSPSSLGVFSIFADTCTVASRSTALPRNAVKQASQIFSNMQHEKFHSAPGSRVGTPAYLAPEVIMTTKGQTYDGKVIQSSPQDLVV